jgi:hypothetical protein
MMSIFLSQPATEAMLSTDTLTLSEIGKDVIDVMSAN